MTDEGTIRRKVDRRDFLRGTLLAAAGAALLLAGCSAPAADEPSADARVTLDGNQGQGDVTLQPTSQPFQEDWGVACPAGLVNDLYPGRCRHYVDRNGDGVCDPSEPGSGNYSPRT